jgi:hypothetical protein
VIFQNEYHSELYELNYFYLSYFVLVSVVGFPRLFCLGVAVVGFPRLFCLGVGVAVVGFPRLFCLGVLWVSSVILSCVVGFPRLFCLVRCRVSLVILSCRCRVSSVILVFASFSNCNATPQCSQISIYYIFICWCYSPFNRI